MEVAGSNPSICSLHWVSDAPCTPVDELTTQVLTLHCSPPPLGISSHTQWLHRYPQAEAPKSITRLYDDTLAFIVCSVSVFVRMCMYMDVCILCSFIAEGLCEYRNLFVGTGGGEWPTNLYNNLGYVLYILSHMRARAVCNIPELGYYG